MSDPTSLDSELLRRYAEAGAEEAFSELVRRHVDLVFAAARRCLGGDEARARDVAQCVFTELARRARDLRDHPTLAGWLYTTTCHLARKQVREEARRARREQRAQVMEESSHEESAPDWMALRPVLDEALAHLREDDRIAVLLRFFEGYSLRAVGEALEISEDAARMRVQRALGRLRDVLASRGLTTSAVSLGTTLGTHALELAPTGFAVSATASALAQAALVAPAAVGTSPAIASLVLSMKTPMLAAGAALVVILVPLTVQQQRLKAARAQAEADRAAGAARPIPVPGDVADSRAAEADQLRALAPELERLRTEAGDLRASLAVPGRAALQAAQQELQSAQQTRGEAEAEVKLRTARREAIQALMHLGVAARIYSTSHEDRLPESFEEFAANIDTNSEAARSLERFEFYPQPRKISLDEPGLFLMREKAMRQRADGTFERAYALIDGSVQLLQSATEDFSAEERRLGGVATLEDPAAGGATTAPTPNP
ncbi:MAG: sigma-70 family RNA polymerase sigma factor [Verrucomicrobiales bacterium]|nr:sigma-70 family RNA polymerase sigma factor [Verrucomicrobiales bacterium]